MKDKNIISALADATWAPRLSAFAIALSLLVLLAYLFIVEANEHSLDNSGASIVALDPIDTRQIVITNFNDEERVYDVRLQSNERSVEIDSFSLIVPANSSERQSFDILDSNQADIAVTVVSGQNEWFLISRP